MSTQLSAARRAAEEDLLLAPVAQSLTAESGTKGFGFENIVGVGTLSPLFQEHPRDEPVVAVYVARKAPLGSVDPVAVVPDAYEDVPTQVVETGEFVTMTERGRHRPAPSGVSVGHCQGETGSLGFIGRKGEGLMLVSNNHVLARSNEAALGDSIFQPGTADGGDGSDQIATLAEFVDLDFSGGRNSVDAAMAAVDADDVDGGVYGGSRLMPEPIEPAIGMTVRKCGRTTGVTHGIVYDDDATIKLRYSVGTALLGDQMLIRSVNGRPFSAPGDSGSLVVDERSDRPTGLLCGGSPRFTIANRVEMVLDKLGVSFYA